MGFLGVILFFLIVWILVLAVMVIFAILCIIFSAISVSSAKLFLALRQYPDYKKAKGRYIAALVFFILTCLTSAGALLSPDAGAFERGAPGPGAGFLRPAADRGADEGPHR